MAGTRTEPPRQGGRHPPVGIGGVGAEPGPLPQLSRCRVAKALARLERARDAMPVRALARRTVEDEELLAATHENEDLLGPPHAGNTTSARVPPSRTRSKLPCSSSRTSARTIESPVPARAPSGPKPSSAIASTTSPSRPDTSIRTPPAP